METELNERIGKLEAQVTALRLNFEVMDARMDDLDDKVLPWEAVDEQLGGIITMIEKVQSEINEVSSIGKRLGGGGS